RAGRHRTHRRFSGDRECAAVSARRDERIHCERAALLCAGRDSRARGAEEGHAVRWGGRIRVRNFGNGVRGPGVGVRRWALLVLGRWVWVPRAGCWVLGAGFWGAGFWGCWFWVLVLGSLI